jgi:hypothetical protein
MFVGERYPWERQVGRARVDEDVRVREVVKCLDGWPYCKEDLHEGVVPPEGTDTPWTRGVCGGVKIRLNIVRM